MTARSLVSIIVPCYNVEKTVARALNSVYSQTYRPIELIVVNDGSTDNTEAEIEKTTAKFGHTDIYVKYVKQQNRGLGGAIDAGLKHYTGDYLAWFDSDDELMPTSVEKRVSFLENNPDFACVTSDAFVVNCDEWEKPVQLISETAKENENENQFELLLDGQSIFCCGCHLIRASVFNSVNPSKSIYSSRAGQNWQLLLPVYYNNKRAFLPEPLYKYGLYVDNMTAQIEKMPFDKRVERQLEYIEIIRNTLNAIKGMPKRERKKYIKLFETKVYRKILDISAENKKRSFFLKYVLKLSFSGAVRFNDIKWLIKLCFKKTAH